MLRTLREKVDNMQEQMRNKYRYGNSNKEAKGTVINQKHNKRNKLYFWMSCVSKLTQLRKELMSLKIVHEEISKLKCK